MVCVNRGKSRSNSKLLKLQSGVVWLQIVAASATLIHPNTHEKGVQCQYIFWPIKLKSRCTGSQKDAAGSPGSPYTSSLIRERRDGSSIRGGLPGVSRLHYPLVTDEEERGNHLTTRTVEEGRAVTENSGQVTPPLFFFQHHFLFLCLGSVTEARRRRLGVI